MNLKLNGGKSLLLGLCAKAMYRGVMLGVRAGQRCVRCVGGCSDGQKLSHIAERIETDRRVGLNQIGSRGSTRRGKRRHG